MLSYTKIVQGEGEGLPQRGEWERPKAQAPAERKRKAGPPEGTGGSRALG